MKILVVFSIGFIVHAMCNKLNSLNRLAVFLAVFALLLTSGCTVRPVSQEIDKVYFERVKEFEERTLSDGEVAALSRLIDLKEGPPLIANPDTSVWHGVNPEFTFRIYSPSFNHHGFGFLFDGSPMFRVDSESSEEIRKLVMRINGSRSREFQRSWSIGGPE